jgi:hypothetical protein
VSRADTNRPCHNILPDFSDCCRGQLPRSRGCRLRLLLKIELTRWLAEVEPQLKIIET